MHHRQRLATQCLEGVFVKKYSTEERIEALLVGILCAVAIAAMLTPVSSLPVVGDGTWRSRESRDVDRIRF